MEEHTQTLEKRKLNIEEALEAMDAPTICKMCDLVFYVDQVITAFDGPELEEEAKTKLDNLKWEANDLREYLWNDLQIRGLEYEAELKKLNSKNNTEL